MEWAIADVVDLCLAEGPDSALVLRVGHADGRPPVPGSMLKLQRNCIHLFDAVALQPDVEVAPFVVDAGSDWSTNHAF